MNYTGLKCPVCGKAFTPDDDIVVCPECGAPYHRECYVKAGKCIYSDKHGTPGSAWRPPEEETRPGANGGTDTGEMVRCPRCGTMNHVNALFCQHCGLPLGEADNKENTRGQNGKQPFGQGQSPFGEGQPIFFDPLGGVNPNDAIDGISAGEVAKFVQNGTQYYIPVFMNLKKFAKNRFNFSAFLLPGIWMLYRKMYKVGAVLTAVVAALYVCSAYVTYNFIMPIFESISTALGYVIDPFSMTSQQLNMFASKLGALPVGQRLLCNIPAIVLLIQIVIMIISGFSANRMYLKHSVSSIRQIRQDVQNNEQAAIRVAETGGVNTFVATCAVIIYIIIYYIVSSF